MPRRTSDVVLFVSSPVFLIACLVGMLAKRSLEGSSGCPGGAEWTAIMLLFGSIVIGLISFVMTALALVIRK